LLRGVQVVGVDVNVAATIARTIDVAVAVAVDVVRLHIITRHHEMLTIDDIVLDDQPIMLLTAAVGKTSITATTV
jgi:hypothetical protein